MKKYYTGNICVGLKPNTPQYVVGCLVNMMTFQNNFEARELRVTKLKNRSEAVFQTPLFDKLLVYVQPRIKGIEDVESSCTLGSFVAFVDLVENNKIALDRNSISNFVTEADNLAYSEPYSPPYLSITAVRKAFQHITCCSEIFVNVSFGDNTYSNELDEMLKFLKPYISTETTEGTRLGYVRELCGRTQKDLIL